MSPARRDGPRAMQTHAVRRRTPGPDRRRRWRTAALALVLAGGLGAGIWWAVTSPVFAVTRVQTGAYRFTDPQALDPVLSSFLGRNLWRLAAAEVADSLRALPWIKDLQVGRCLPGTVTVDFREWRPLAVMAPQDLPAAGRDRLWVLTDGGAVIAFPQSLATAGLPTVVGCRPRPEGDGAVMRLDAEESSGLLELFSAIADAGLEAECPVDFVIVGDDGYAIVLQNRRGRLLVGREEFGARLARYMTAQQHLQPGLDVDLRFADRVTVRRPED